MMSVKIFTDWGSRWNPWEAGIWVVIYNLDDAFIEKRYKYLWICSNNVAEYMGVFYGIKRAGEIGAKELFIYMDSQLVQKQLSGERKIKDEKLKTIFKDIQDLIQKEKLSVSYSWIPREKNKEADRLANKAIDLK